MVLWHWNVFFIQSGNFYGNSQISGDKIEMELYIIFQRIIYEDNTQWCDEMKS